jgi:hypothetical protein
LAGRTPQRVTTELRWLQPSSPCCSLSWSCR